jgi:tyrosyl-tRNA synthetase
MKYIEQRSSVINPLTDFKKLKESKKSLRIKLGVDPTAPDVTLGWYAVIRALKKFQEYGHTAVLILGEFTAQVGDPSGKSETRNLIEEKEIDTNSKGVLPIIKNILDKDNLEIVSNKDWLGKLDVNKIMELASSTTLAQMLEREDFAKRYSEKNSISLLEFFYPLYQGYDSVAVKADIEIGGNDQLWNLMLGREIQKYYKMEPQVAVTFPLLIGTDGKKKMSQSYNNYISLSDSPENIFGKIMSLPDNVMWEYFLMLTDLDIKEIDSLKDAVEKDKENPFNIKKLLGELVIKDIFDDNTANKAAKTFEDLTINKNIPEIITEISLKNNEEIHLPTFLTENKILKSNSEARRLIDSGGFKINEQKYNDLDINSSKLIDNTIQVGKRNYFRIIKK